MFIKTNEHFQKNHNFKEILDNAVKSKIL